MEPKPIRNSDHPTPRARGVTLLEAVFAVVLLGMVAATLAGAFGAIRGGIERQRQMRGAAELANRLIIIQADDERMMPAAGVPVSYGEQQYRWSMRISPVRVTLSEAGEQAADENQQGGARFDQRLRNVTVDVWLAEDSGGAFDNAAGVPSASFSRIVDPLSPGNYDSFQRRVERPGGLEEIFSDVLSLSGSEGGEAGGRTIGGNQRRSDGER